MKPLARRLLLLLLAVLLTPPAGWCCILPRPTAPDAKAPAAPPVAEPCCPLCRPPAPAPEDDPAPPQAPSCCCHDKDRLPDQRVEAPAVDLAQLLPFDVVALDAIAPHRTAVIAESPPPKRPLHLLRCVWLC